MNLVTLASPAAINQPLAVESIEERLAPSPTLPLPPPHIDPSMVASLTPPEPCVQTVREAATKPSPTFLRPLAVAEAGPPPSCRPKRWPSWPPASSHLSRANSPFWNHLRGNAISLTD